MKWTLTPKQQEWAGTAWMKLIQYKMVYLMHQERAGKSGIALWSAQASCAKRVLIVTTKDALSGWDLAIDSFGFDIPHIKVINYESVHKLHRKEREAEIERGTARAYKLYTNKVSSGSDIKRAELTYTEVVDKLHKKWLDGWEDTYDFVILDEAHKFIAGFPWAGSIRDSEDNIMRMNADKWQTIRHFCRGNSIVYASATPHSEGLQQMFHPLGLSDFNPIKLANMHHRDPYRWWRRYGIPNTVFTGSSTRETYTKIRIEAEDAWKHIFVYGTRAEAGHTVEPVHTVLFTKVPEVTAKHIGAVLKHGVVSIKGYTVVCDSASKTRQVLHQLEGGTVKVDGEVSIATGDISKINTIKAKCEELGCDPSNVAIMYNFKEEEGLLRLHFPNAFLKQASKVTGYTIEQDIMFIYSQNYSAANHSQRCSRGCAASRTESLQVFHLLMEGMMSHKVYECVMNKHTNFNSSYYEAHLKALYELFGYPTS